MPTLVPGLVATLSPPNMVDVPVVEVTEMVEKDEPPPLLPVMPAMQVPSESAIQPPVRVMPLIYVEVAYGA